MMVRGKGGCDDGKLKGPTVVIEEVPVTPGGSSQGGRREEFEGCYERTHDASFV